MSRLDRCLLRVVGVVVLLAGLVYLTGHVTDWYFWRRDTSAAVQRMLEAGVRLERQVKGLSETVQAAQAARESPPSPVAPGKVKK